MPYSDRTESWWKKTLRALVVAVVTSIIVIGFLQLVYGSQSAQQRETLAQQRDATLALACELALPVSPVSGRDLTDVTRCFTQYGLKPPILHTSEGG